MIKKIHSMEFYNFFKEKHKNENLSRTEYTEILEKFNEKLALVCIQEGIGMSLGSELGSVQIFRRLKRAKGELRMRPNHAESKKLKAEILARGGVPFKSIRNEFGKVIGDNGGEKWLIYYTTEEPSLTMKWLRHRFPPMNVNVFKFKPSRRPMRELLPEFKNKNKDKIELIYELSL